MLGMGALSALALPPVHCLPILLLTFPILGCALNTAPNWKKAAWAGALFGFGFYAANLYWLVNAVMIRAEEFWWFVPFPSLGCALILAPMVAAPAALSRLAPAGPRRLLAFAGSWTLFDMGRVFLFSGFTWNPLGSALAIPGTVGDVLIQPAAWIGVDGLTLFVVLGALFGGAALQDAIRARTDHPCRFFPHRVDRLRIAACFVAVIGISLAASMIRLHSVHPVGEPGPIAVLVQGNVPETEKVGHLNPRDIFTRYLHLTADGVLQAHKLQPRSDFPDAVTRPIVFLWPETSFPGSTLLQDSPRARRMIMNWAPGADAGFIGALRVDEDGRYRNSVLALAPDGDITAIYDKARLVPFGEYQPPFIPLQIVPQGGMAAGPGAQTWHVPGLPPVGPLVCYEVIFSGLTVNGHDRPRWLANVTNDGWFGNSAGPRQHLSSVRLRAVEEGLPIARAANTGISIAYDGFGHELARLGWGKTGTLVVSLPAALPAPLFAQYGRTLPALLSLAVFLAAFIRPRRKSEKTGR
ncbi:apolipoprotein N-acyltransferase [Acetobacter orleanensis]|uniref:Apolipoprotein N-acyltransferase n=1 Tax=Acetobacter orleanensis TaxID=104099 RepID=A0A4Y3TMZ4_9PROT|nr:apolipoprotein N-acyltransferase [Acetobacter orleanensis]PCD78954.1 apolipoprotein N-acyltransferase [Acetobacter orleanensis]GAN67827.1 apolipoprotein N-acyltransferase [Acetobacter orleanensis JCM 7639]GBR27828.1 apolipoprotein N-acyltransferase [Acetobacter orleanensis NRIC 0473]GEB83164.1 apolipoprotein N-acyltransferase [Acetobacter orleanensis]